VSRGAGWEVWGTHCSCARLMIEHDTWPTASVDPELKNEFEVLVGDVKRVA
jgi:hypothetical protein